MSLKDRILFFIEQKGISVQKFEQVVGLSNASVAKMGDNTRKSTIDKISNIFPELNKTWLLTGEGKMILDENAAQSNKEIFPMNAHLIPLLPISAQAGKLNDFIASGKNSDCEKVVSPIKGADFAMSVAGDSMYPEYPNGSQIHIKKINENAFIEWGKVYVLDTCNGIIIKRIIPSDKESYVKCVSINPDPTYAPFEVSQKDIFGIYRVILCLSIK